MIQRQDQADKFLPNSPNYHHKNYEKIYDFHIFLTIYHKNCMVDSKENH